MTRKYENYSKHIECFVYDGYKLVAHLIYYKSSGSGYPRYHFENFSLQFQSLNYEICRFMKAVNKIQCNPRYDLETLDTDLNFSLF